VTTPPSLDDAVKAGVVPYTKLRVALTAAALGGIGASLGWLACLAYEARSRAMLISALVGAVLGFVVHWLQHYVRTALRERRGEPSHHAHHPWLALLWVAGSTLIALASEHLLGEMLVEFVRPFLASVASLVPAGAIIGWTMSRGRKKDQNLLELVAEGLLIGLSIAIVTGIIWTFAIGDVPWGALCAWWGLIGLATRLMTGVTRNAVRAADPIVAVAMVFAGTFFINLLPITEGTYDVLGPFRTMPLVIRTMALEVRASPGFPAHAWLKAEEGVSRPPTPAAPSNAAPPKFDRTGSTVTRGALQKAGADAVTVPDRSVQGELSVIKENGAELVRSWLIIVLFAVGVGLAPTVERVLRPIDYPSSETFKRDLLIAAGLAALPVIACLVGLAFGPL
jgi:hypothetical protein